MSEYKSIHTGAAIDAAVTQAPQTQAALETHITGAGNGANAHVSAADRERWDAGGSGGGKYSATLTPWVPASGVPSWVDPSSTPPNRYGNANGRKYFYELALMGLSEQSGYTPDAMNDATIFMRKKASVGGAYAYDSVDGGATLSGCYVGSEWYYLKGYFVKADGERLCFGTENSVPKIGIFSPSWEKKLTIDRPVESDGTLVDNMLTHTSIGEANGTIMLAHYNPDSATRTSVWRSKDNGRTWESCLELKAHGSPEREIRHLHGVQADPYTPGCWLAHGGDLDTQNSWYVTTDDGDTWTKVLTGIYARAIHVFFTKERIYWGTDDATRSGSFCIYTKTSNPLTVINEADIKVFPFPNVIAGIAACPWGFILLGHVESTMIEGDKNNVYIGVYDWYDDQIHIAAKFPNHHDPAVGYGGFLWDNSKYPVNGKYFCTLGINDQPDESLVTAGPRETNWNGRVYVLELSRTNAA